MRPHRLRRLFSFYFYFCSCCYDKQILSNTALSSFFRKKPAKFRFRKPASEKKSLDMAKAARLVPCSFKKRRIRCPIWKEHFRVTRPTFAYICNLVGPDLRKQQTRTRTPVSVEEGLDWLCGGSQQVVL